jgi:Flp pilus assembly protein TadG
MKKKSLLPISARGQSLVEFAISLVILLWLLSGAVEFGVAFFQYVQLRDAAQEGALYGSINPTNFPMIESRARASSNSPVNLSLSGTNPAKVAIYINDVKVREDGVNTGASVTSTACESNSLKVVVSYRHKIFMPFMARILNRQSDPYIDLNAEVTDTILTPVCP